MMKYKIDSNMFYVLTLIAEMLEKKTIKWSVLGSCALALNGVDIQPCDIDILTDNAGVLQISKILKDYEISFVENETSSGMFESYLARFLIRGVIIEVMGDLKYKSKLDNQWHHLYIDSFLPRRVAISNFKVPIAPLWLLRELYKKWRREKDLPKLSKIKLGRKMISC